MVVDARRAGLDISEATDLLDFNAQPSLWFTESGPKEEKYPVSSSSDGENGLLMPKMSEENYQAVLS